MKGKRRGFSSTTNKACLPHFIWQHAAFASRLGKGRSMRCSKFKGERGDASRSKRHCYLSISKDPPPTKAEQKIKAQNRTYVYVRFWALGFYLAFVRSCSFGNIGITTASGTTCVQSFPLELDATHRSALVRR